jgi:HAD superfamily phosphoserine phosphatase-like hydrolase
MSLVATLICNPANPALDTTIVDGALAVLPSPGTAQWLFDEVAVDIPFDYQVKSPDDIKAIEARLQAARGDLPIDIVVQPVAFRRKKLFLADMDSTMIGQECIDELADFAGLKAHVAGITERAMRGEIEFEPALRERVALLKDLPVGVVDEVLAKRITPTPGGRELVMTMRANGAYTCLISGGFTLFTNAVAAKIGFQRTRQRARGSRRQVHRRVAERFRPRRQAGNADRPSRILRPRRNRHAGDWRRRQRSRHDRGGRARRRLSRQARGRRHCRRADRLRRPHRVAVCARLSARRVRGLIEIGLWLTPAT